MAVVIKEAIVYKFALKTFEKLVALGYPVVLSNSNPGSDLFIIPGSPFGDRSIFRNNKKSRYQKGPIKISGTDYYMTSDWYEDKSKGVLCIDNLKDYVSKITSGAYIIYKDKDGNFVLDELMGVSSTSSMSAPITTPSVTYPILSGKSLECKDLLEANHNIILSGAPGTGKTYMAKQIALAMTGSEDRIGFVQFHPSYDYTDFVEGLRPTSASGSTIGFERKDGIFKEFCEKALTDTVPSHHLSPAAFVSPSIATIYGSLVTGIRSGAITSLPLRTGVSMDASVSPQDNIILSTHGGGNSYTVSLDDIMKLSKTYPDKDSLDNMKNIDKEIRAVLGDRHSSSIWAVLYEIYTRLESASSIIINNKSTVDVEKAKYVFIIDEINRGEMSKVFGELFFSIDPGYRGKSGAVRTQYANMVTKPNAFDEVLEKSNPKDFGHFFVPENVYIIGTMNDIDRSVDSMDFAMRRRFLIKDIKAKDTQEDMLKLEIIQKIYRSVTAIEPKVVEKMNALNNVIEGKPEKKIKAKLGSSYSLGASYFQKYYKYNDFDKLWEYHLEGILREYLRGTQDPEGDLNILNEVYEKA